VLHDSAPIDPAAGPVVAPPDGSGAPPSSPSAPGADAPTIAPSCYRAGSSETPSIAFAQYNPRTGKYITPDGKQFQQTNLMTSPGPDSQRTWKDLFPT